MSDIPNKSMLLDLENAVLAIEQSGFKEEEIFAFVNMILKGFITNGTWTPEYLQMVANMIEERKKSLTRTVDTPPQIITTSR